jgi:hypothetical protein
MEIYVYKGTMPTNLSSSPIMSLITAQASNLLCAYGPRNKNARTDMKIACDPATYSWSLTETHTEMFAVGSGTATWFLTTPANIADLCEFDYWVCDSISLVGGGEILQLEAMEYSAGEPAPVIMDFSLKL